MSGWVAIVGLGPGAQDLVTPAVSAAIEAATDILGYGPYVARIDGRRNQTKHISDNGDEIARARHALELAARGQQAVIVSSGDPGVFAMASALFEAMEAGPADWRGLDVRVLPGVTAMLAAAARIGAPLGHDFCAINLSDNLKPWSTVEHRLRLAAEADFAMALYNPRSKARPDDFVKALGLLRDACGPERIIIFARAISTPDEAIATTTLADATPEMADMRTVVIVGSSQTRAIEGSPGPKIYTPRSYTPGRYTSRSAPS